MRDEYTFVTLEKNLVTTGDVVFVDIDETVNSELDFVQIDDSYVQFDDSSDFMMMDDMDIESFVSDICEADVTIIL